MPGIDGVVILQAGIGALPSSLSNLAKKFLGVNGVKHLVRLGAGHQTEGLTLLNSGHEGVGDTHRVVGVLILNADDVAPAQVHVEPGIAQSTNLVLLARLGLDELFDIGVIDVKDDHLGSTTSGAA